MSPTFVRISNKTFNFNKNPIPIKLESKVSYDVKTTRVVLSVEACLFIQRSYRGLPVSGLIAKCLLARLRSII